jgi:hypothetical protein
VFGPASSAEPSGEAWAEAEREVSLVGIGSDVLAFESDEAEADQWGLHGSLKLWAPIYVEGGWYDEEGAFKDMGLMMGAGLALSRGRSAVSASFVFPLDEFQDSLDWYDPWGDPVNADAEIRYFYGDIRYHYSMNENLSVGIGYKVGYVPYEHEEVGDDYAWVWEEEGDTWGHGPGLIANVSYPLWDTDFSLVGSVLVAPAVFMHSSVDIDYMEASGYAESSSETTTDIGWFVNPEIGVRWDPCPGVNLSASYRMDATGNYDDGDESVLAGPSVTAAISF